MDALWRALFGAGGSESSAALTARGSDDDIEAHSGEEQDVKALIKQAQQPELPTSVVVRADASSKPRKGVAFSASSQMASTKIDGGGKEQLVRSAMGGGV